MTRYTFHLIPHTHWDREWYLPRSAFQARLVPMLDDLIERLRSDPRYRRFLLDGQTVLLEDYLEARPDQEGAIQALAVAGRLEVGPWYVLADEQIPSGEALARNLLAGLRDTERLGGRMEALYSPDAFGHPAILPTLAREFGLSNGALWRGLETARDLVIWRGPDGAELLLYHLPPDGYEIGAALPADSRMLGSAWARVRRTVVPRAATTQVAVFVGADHHGAHPELPELRDQLAGLESESEFRISGLAEFLRAARAEARNVPLVSGELRWSYGYAWTLQGVHGTRTPLKRRNSGLELRLEREAEPLAALAYWGGGRDRRPLLDLAWRRLLRCQFHDSICGTVSDPVARAMETRFDEVEAMLAEIARSSLQEIHGLDPDRARNDPASVRPRLVLWNPAARPRAGVTIADLTSFRRDVPVGAPRRGTSRSGPGYRPFALRDGHGKAIPVQIIEMGRDVERLDAVHHYPDVDQVDRVRVAFSPPSMRGLGFADLMPSRPGRGRPLGHAWARGRALGNEAIEIRVEPAGSLRLKDLRSGEEYSGLIRLESEADIGDAYTFCPPARARRRAARQGRVQTTLLARGPLVAALEARWELVAGAGANGGKGTVAARLRVELHTGSPVARIQLVVDNRALNHRLRARFPTGLRGCPVVVGAQFGLVERMAMTGDAKDFPMETPVRTAPAHRFVAVARGARGLGCFAPGFFEYEWTERGDLLLTVLRAVGELSRGDLRTRPGHAAWPVPTPRAQCQGLDRLELALAPVSSDLLSCGGELVHLWEDAFVPIRGYWFRDAAPPPGPPRPGSGSVELRGSGLVFSACKPPAAGQGLVLRCYNIAGEPVQGAWCLEGSAPIQTASRLRADEREPKPLRVDPGDSVVPITVGRGELFTVRAERPPRV